MDVNGAWVGYGLGDSAPAVLLMKENFVKRFSYAAPLQESINAGGAAAELYDATMVAVVTQMQKAYLADPKTIQGPGLVANGVMNFAWQIRSGYLPAPKIVLLTWQGTGVSMWDTDSPQPYGAALYVAKNCPNVLVQPVGNYPASINAPWMGTSVKMGVDSAVSILGGAPPINAGDPVYPTQPVVLFGYSQGAICASHLLRDEILSPAGRLSGRKVIAGATFGNPCRCPGKANGNVFAKWGMPGLLDGEVTGGIAGPDCLTAEQTGDNWYDFVWLGSDGGGSELYTNCPVGPNPWTALAAPGKVGNLIYNFIQQGTFIDFVEIAEALETPKAMVEEIYNGLVFALKGPNADHFAYNWQPAIDALTQEIQTWTNNYVYSGGAVS